MTSENQMPVAPTQPSAGSFGPKLPADGWVGATGIWFSDVIAIVLLVYSIRRWR